MDKFKKSVHVNKSMKKSLMFLGFALVLTLFIFGVVGALTYADNNQIYINSSYGAGSFSVYNTSGFTNFFINGSNGNIGIGTTSPSYETEIVTSSDGTAIKFGNGAGGYLSTYSPSNQTSISSGASLSGGTWTARHTSAAGIDLNPVAGQIILWTNTGLTPGNSFSPTNRVGIDNNGNVGIGTTTPATTLQVGTTLYVNNSNGNVGIGTISPQATLNVVGTLNSTLNISSDANILVQQTSKFCLNGNTCTHYITYNGTATIIQ